jgi:hypothetical protein
MTLNLQAGLFREVGIAMLLTFVLASFVAYCLVARRSRRRRRIVEVELRLEAAWENFKTALGITGSRKSTALASAFLGGLQAGPQGRILSHHGLSAQAAKEPEPSRLPLVGAAAAGSEPSSTAAIETVQQTQISCDI